MQVWSAVCLEPLYLLHPYLEDRAGDLFSLAWCSTLQTIFIGCQNTSLQWYNFRNLIPRSDSSSSIADTGSQSGTTSSNGASRKAHKFFDSYPQYERKPADIFAKNRSVSSRPGRGSPDSDCTTPPSACLNIPAMNVIDSAHYGYIYCMIVLAGEHGTLLATGSGDETVKVRYLVAKELNKISAIVSCGIAWLQRAPNCCTNSPAAMALF